MTPRGLMAGLAAVLAVALGAGLVRTGLKPAGPPRDLPLGSLGADGSPGRIVAFGTSLTQGNGWPDRLAVSLSDCFGHPVEVLRVAGPGQGSAWALGQVARVAALDPDVVLIEFAINDADLRDGVGRAAARAQHAALVDALGAALPGARLVLMTMSPASGLRGMMRPRLAGHYADVADLAGARDLGLIDFYPRWKDGGPGPARDGLHPDDAATEQVMDGVLLSAFATAAGRRCPG